MSATVQRLKLPTSPSAVTLPIAAAVYMSATVQRLKLPTSPSVETLPPIAAVVCTTMAPSP